MSLKWECQLNGNVTQIGMSLKYECHSYWHHSNLNVIQILMSLILECHSHWNVTQIGMSPKSEYHLIGKDCQIEMSLKLECHLNVTLLKFECHSNWNVS